MRLNLPVSQQEHPFPGGEAILFASDTSSPINAANAGTTGQSCTAASSPCDPARPLPEASTAFAHQECRHA